MAQILTLFWWGPGPPGPPVGCATVIDHKSVVSSSVMILYGLTYSSSNWS